MAEEIRTGKMTAPVWVMDRNYTEERVYVCFLLKENDVDVRIPLEVAQARQFIVDIMGAMRGREWNEFLCENRHLFRITDWAGVQERVDGDECEERDTVGTVVP